LFADATASVYDNMDKNRAIMAVPGTLTTMVPDQPLQLVKIMSPNVTDSSVEAKVRGKERKQSK
jgi:hypothetical protein